MASNWQRRKVIDLQNAGLLLVEDGNHGNDRPRPNEFCDEGVAFIRAADMDGGRVLFSSAQCINETARKRIRKGIGSPGDVLLSHKGTVGKVAATPIDAPNFVCSPQTTFYRTLDEDKLDRVFLFQFLKSREFQNELASIAGETDMAGYASLTNQRRLHIALPPIEEQREIGKLLGTLDDKIELNRRMNATLEAMARALFQSWFVDFDPVQAKAAGQTPAGMDPATAALFPSELEDSALGKIPKGWSKRRADEFSRVTIGKTPPRKEPEWFSESEVDIPWVSIRDLGTSGTYVSQTSERLTQKGIDRFNVRVVPRDTVILSFKLTVGRVAITDVDLATNEAIAHFGIDPASGVTTEFLYLSLLAFDFDSLGSTSSIATAVNSDSVRSIEICMPPAELISAFSTIVRPLFSKIRSNQTETRTLIHTRDALLPPLLSGELSTSGLGE